MTKMRKKDPGEAFWHAYLLRPVVWFFFQFSGEARTIHKYRKYLKTREENKG